MNNTHSSDLTALIDADIYIYQAAVAAEHPIHWGDTTAFGDDLWTFHASMNEAIECFDAAVGHIKLFTGCDRVICALSDTRNFRCDIYPEYKYNRRDKRPPILRGELKAWLLNDSGYTTFLRPGLEGDDVLGILATSKALVKGPRVVATLDKDMRSIPGDNYNSKTGVLCSISAHEADSFHLRQTLMGDPTDGYPGCPGVGPVKADKLLEPFYNDSDMPIATAWTDIILPAYAKAGLGAEYALTQARVARICRNTDYDFRRKKVILWDPFTTTSMKPVRTSKKSRQ
jgi:DNA polymerase-1